MRLLDLGAFQPAHKLSLLTGGLRPTGTMNPPFAKVDIFLHKYVYNRPGKCDQVTKIVKMDSGVLYYDKA